MIDYCSGEGMSKPIACSRTSRLEGIVEKQSPRVSWRRKKTFREIDLRSAKPGKPRLMPEMPRAGEHHGDAMLVSGFDHFVVAHGAAGLDHRGGAGLDGDE